MATQAINFSLNRGTDLFDPNSKSTFSVPGAYCDDLAGCGFDTHDRGSIAVNFNYREECEAPIQGLTYSYSGFHARSDSSADNSLYNFEYTFPTNIAVAVNLSTLLTSTAKSGLPVVSDVIGVDPDLVDIKRIGAQLLVYKKQSKRVIATLQRPVLTDVIDACGNSLGSKYSTSLAFFGFDSASCKSTTLWQASYTVFINPYLYPLTEATRLDKVAEDLFVTFGIDQITAAVKRTVACNQLQNSAETVWLGIQGESHNIGMEET